MLTPTHLTHEWHPHYPEAPPYLHPPRGEEVWGTLPRAPRVFRHGPGEAQPDPGAVVWLPESAPPMAAPA